MNNQKQIADTPLMRQYFSIKAKHPTAILLFRVGDFYETFGEDAITASKVLGIVLTRRANGTASHVELAGFPHHSIDSYLPKLVRAGYKVAVCDQLEDPKLTKKIVKRGVTELVTPGVAYNDQLLSNKENNYLASLYFHKNKAGIAFLDISTGEFKVAEGSLDYIDLLLSSMNPKELLMERSVRRHFEERFGKDYYISDMDEWAFIPEASKEKTIEQFGTHSLKGFGVEEMPLAITAAGAILFYLELTRHDGLGHLCSLSRIDEGNYVWIDKFTFRNLEIFSGAQEGAASLVQTVDRCSTPMGSRMLRNWLAMPIKNIDELNIRLNIVESIKNNNSQREKLIETLSQVGDLERVVSKAAAGRITPREVTMLKKGLEQITPIKELCSNFRCEEIKELTNRLDCCSALLERLNQEILPDPAGQIGKGNVIASGVNQELDNLRNIARHGKDILAQIQRRESDSTGISSLKIGYNNVFGYYLEVRNTHKDKVPEHWIRKQTLVSAERYITEELKEYEEKILGAQDKILALEQLLFSLLVEEIQKSIAVIQKNAELISRLDCLTGYATLAQEKNYSKPELNLGFELEIKEGRHPVIESLMPPGEEYIANDLSLDNNNEQIIILTGPNMSGKSALLRQTALITLMAQTGSFVPAAQLKMGIIDKIFTRVGASDNISKGESTFMVEMLETSTILHNLSSRSLVLLDEIGRGTSTYDGMSIAWAIVEYLHQHKEYRAKTLFATHYHELNNLEEKFPRVKNWHISVKEVNKNIIFLRKLCRGGVAHSFGIHVARMAGMPREVVSAAERILKQLEKTNSSSPSSKEKRTATLNEDAVQLSFYQLEDPLLIEIRDELKNLDINTLSPLDAFDKLRNLKKRLGL
ncbi:MAG: DNA mismatch repair protein MutS [Bacteroidales bacterium]|nr:DNA mismatch repair protein MutS [Bacteroidales bacterium]MDD4656819.1 DNA mismatch repair protein MutS [Bacteroidales bacterium]